MQGGLAPPWASTPHASVPYCATIWRATPCDAVARHLDHPTTPSPRSITITVTATIVADRNVRVAGRVDLCGLRLHLRLVSVRWSLLRGADQGLQVPAVLGPAPPLRQEGEGRGEGRKVKGGGEERWV